MTVRAVALMHKKAAGDDGWHLHPDVLRDLIAGKAGVGDRLSIVKFTISVAGTQALDLDTLRCNLLLQAL